MTRPLKVGVQLPEVERPVRWAELIAMAQEAERIGLDSIWYGDHLIYRAPGEVTRAPWEAWSILAALAVATTRVEIGPLVACTSFHNPAMIAKKATTIDEISSGRLILGLGAGWNNEEYRVYGFPYDHRASRFEEAFTIIRSLLHDGYVDFHGRYYDVTDAPLIPKGPRPSGPPLMIGSHGQRMLRFTLPHADAWNAWYADYGNTPDGLRGLVDEVDAICSDVGRDPSTLLKSICPLVQMPGGTGRPSGDPAVRAIPPIRFEEGTLAGALRTYAEMGIGHVQLVLDPITVESIGQLQPVLAELDQ